jgi:hypothetical protein
MIGSPLPDRASRLAFVAQELHQIRTKLAELTGEPRCAEVRMCQDLECALAELIQQAERPRSRTGCPAVYQPSAKGESNG